MNGKSDIEFESLLRSLILSQEETLKRDALRNKMRGRIGRAFRLSSSHDNVFETSLANSEENV